MANDRYKSEDALENSRRTSREAKRRRRGLCACGATTGYDGRGGVSKQCVRCGRRASALKQRGHGYTVGRILRLVEQQGEVRFSEIRDSLNISNGHTGQALDRLLRYGLLERPRRGVYMLPQTTTEARK